MRGFSAIGLVRPKNLANVGSVLRAAGVYDAALVAIEGERVRVRSSADTMQAWKHIPVLKSDNLFDLIPYDAVPVAVDLVDDARPLHGYTHPERAFYIFGPEDGTLGKRILDRCRDRIMIPTRRCMNLAATVNVVLYDRAVKRGFPVAA